ncbi:MAG: glycosyltransferase family 4 protein [Gemmataceae bacterium]
MTTRREPNRLTNQPASGKGVKPPREVIGRFLPTQENPVAVVEPNRAAPDPNHRPNRLPVVILCLESAESFLGQHVSQTILSLARRGREVHLVSRSPYSLPEKQCRQHVVSVETPEDGDLVSLSERFADEAETVLKKAIAPGQDFVAMGYEWSSVPTLERLQLKRKTPTLLSLHSLEWQRSDLASELSRKIAATEQQGVSLARGVLVHDHAAAEAVRQWLPNTSGGVHLARTPFPIAQFESNLDAGSIKARYQVGPIDPTILFVGDLDERYGPDVALKAMPAILRHHPQARLVIVGDGQLYWPLRVYARYLLLEHAVRLVGHLQDEPLRELIQAADLIAVPSREATPWWPIQAGWSARKPVVATHDAARGLTDHEKDAVLVYPSENSFVWGVERILYDEVLRGELARAGRKKLEERFGWDALAEQIDDLLGAVVAT